MSFASFEDAKTDRAVYSSLDSFKRYEVFMDKFLSLIPSILSDIFNIFFNESIKPELYNTVIINTSKGYVNNESEDYSFSS